jgi:hypothetical protein
VNVKTSRSAQLHDIVIGLFINRYEFGIVWFKTRNAMLKRLWSKNSNLLNHHSARLVGCSAQFLSGVRLRLEFQLHF